MTSPYETMMNTSNGNVVRQELHTYEKSDAGMKKITVTRQFFKDDYIDSKSEVILNTADTE